MAALRPCGRPANVLLLLLVSGAHAYEAIDYPTCGSDQYFDISSLNCLQCPAGQSPDAAGTSCQCTNGVLQGTACVACPEGQAPSQDGSICISCLPTLNETCSADVTLGVCNATSNFGGCTFVGECACPAQQAVVERDGVGNFLPSKRCRPCPTGTYFGGADAYTCVACPAPNMVARSTGQGCDCAPGYTSIAHSNGFWGQEVSCVESTAYSVSAAASAPTPTMLRRGRPTPCRAHRRLLAAGLTHSLAHSLTHSHSLTLPHPPTARAAGGPFLRDLRLLHGCYKTVT